MTKKMQIFCLIVVIGAVLAPEITIARGGGSFAAGLAGGMIGTAVVGGAIAGSQNRRYDEKNYYTQRELQDTRSTNYELNRANQKLYDENRELRQRVRDQEERLNRLEERVSGRESERLPQRY